MASPQFSVFTWVKSRTNNGLLQPKEVTFNRLLVGRLGVYVGAVLIFDLLLSAPTWAMWLAAVVFVVVSVYVNHRWPLSAATGSVGWVVFASACLVFLGSAVTVAAFLSDRGSAATITQSALAFGGLAGLFFGLSALVGVIRPAAPPLAGARILGGCLVALVISLVWMRNGAPAALGLAAAALAFAPFGIAIATEWFVAPARPWGKLAVAGGVAGLVALIVFVATTGVSPGVIAAIFVAVPVMLLLFSVRSDIDTVFVVVVLAIAWSTSPGFTSSASVPELQVATKDSVYVAIGDSYMSGEGAPNYLTGTNTRGSNECRRAPSAYSVLLPKVESDALPDRSIFIACSGALAVDLYLRSQYPGEPVGGPKVLQPDGTFGGGQPQLAQLQERLLATEAEVEFVLVSIGGNDAGFGTIARTCLGPGDCTELAKRWTAIFEDESALGLEARLDRAYGEVRLVLPHERVIVVPYPIPINASACKKSALVNNEHEFLNGFTVRLNESIGVAARRHGFEVAEPVAAAFTSHGAELCGAGPRLGVNWVNLNPTDGSLEQLINPQRWFHNSLHPNTYGHGLICDALSRYLHDTAPARTTPAGPATAEGTLNCPRLDVSDTAGPALPTPSANETLDMSNYSAVPEYCEGNGEDCEVRFLIVSLREQILQPSTIALMVWGLVSWLYVLIGIRIYRSS